MPDVTIKTKTIGKYTASIEIVSGYFVSHYETRLTEERGGQAYTIREDVYSTEEKALAAFYRYSKWAKEN